MISSFGEEVSEVKEILRRISVLQLAESLGNVSAACRKSGISRSQYYEYKKRFEAQGIEGLQSHPPIARSHPDTTPHDVADKIRMLALSHPGKGPNYLELLLKSDGNRVNFVTIQKILEREGLGSRHDRRVEPEKQWAEAPIVLSTEQIACIERLNPEFRERHCKSARPGESLCQGVFFAGSCAGTGRMYLHVVVDAYCSYSFGMLHSSKYPEAAISLLHEMVLPFYEKRQLLVSSIITTGASGYCGDRRCRYGHYLKLHGICEEQNPGAEVENGFIERFRLTVIKEFFRRRLSEYAAGVSIAAVQRDFDQWLYAYNRRPRQGYVNNGKAPWGQIAG
ncbi:MAG: transposase [Chlorobiaceae bacterium]|nr:transposase [Chlorobiaceae bacterium]